MFGLDIRALAVAAAMAIAAPAAHAELVLDLTGGGAAAPCGSCGDASGRTVGWEFTVSSTITVDGIGVWDEGADGIGPDVLAGLWNDAGTLLASVTIGNGSTSVASALVAGEWLFESIAAQVLNPGTYRVGSVFYNLTPLARIGTPTLSTIPEISVIHHLIGPGGANSGLADPTDTFGNQVYGPTLRLAMPASEPAGLALAAVGLVGLTALRRRARVG